MEAPMRKVLTQSSTACESALHHPYRAGSPDVSASSSLADPSIHTPTLLLQRDSHRPTFGISLNELKAAIAPRTAHFQGSLDETDRFTVCASFSQSIGFY